MRLRSWVAPGSIALVAAGLGIVGKSFLPQHFVPYAWSETARWESATMAATLPDIGVSFFRCGSVTIPELIAVRGAFSLTPRVLSYSAVLVRHPRATFLYDTGFCTDILPYLAQSPLIFRKTLGTFVFEQPLRTHLQQHSLQVRDLSFALISHLHWDHVSGVPDIPAMPLHINRVEYEAAQQGLLDSQQGLVRRLIGDNPVELFDCAGPSYEGFRSSHDLFSDGSIILVPLPGHTAGNTGMFINRAHGPRLFLIGDAAWVAENYTLPATMHPFIWSAVTADDATARQTLIDLYHFACLHPELPIIAMHDAQMQTTFMEVEQQRKTNIRVQ